MDLLQIAAIAIIQGLTEFLPVSSSAHLILLPRIGGWEDQGLAIDVAAHLGSLCALLLYYRNTFRRMLGWDPRHNTASTVRLPARAGLLILCSSIPVLAVGWLAHDMIASRLRDPVVIGAATIVFGLLLWYADHVGKRGRGSHEIRLRDAMLIGLAQTLALIPGTSRAGITMSAALLLGIKRRDSAQFALLMAMPVILAASGYELLQLWHSDTPITLLHFSVSAALAMLFSLLGIHLFINLVERIGVLPFVIYRVLLGSLLLSLA